MLGVLHSKKQTMSFVVNEVICIVATIFLDWKSGYGKREFQILYCDAIILWMHMASIGPYAFSIYLHIPNIFSFLFKRMYTFCTHWDSNINFLYFTTKSNLCGNFQLYIYKICYGKVRDIVYKLIYFQFGNEYTIQNKLDFVMNEGFIWMFINRN